MMDLAIINRGYLEVTMIGVVLLEATHKLVTRIGLATAAAMALPVITEPEAKEIIKAAATIAVAAATIAGITIITIEVMATTTGINAKIKNTDKPQ